MVASVTNRTAVYGPVRTVVWQGSAGNRCPYADRTSGVTILFESVLRKTWFSQVLPHEPRERNLLRSIQPGDYAARS